MQLQTIGEASICLPLQNKLNYNDMAYHITDHDIQALIDNELDAEEEKFVRELIKKNIYAQKRYEELKQQKNLIQMWWSKKNA